MKNAIRKLTKRLFYSRPKIGGTEKILLSAIALGARLFLVDGSKRTSYLEYWQKRGVSIVPHRYFEPVPEISEVRLRTAGSPLLIGDWKDTDFDREIEKTIASQSELDQVMRMFSAIMDNPMFNGVDLIACEKIIRRFSPKRVVEIGAGYSTYAFLKLSEADCRITSIEPFPSKFLKDLASEQERVTLIEKKIQDFDDLQVFAELQVGDVLFVDSTHVCNIGGDLPVIFSQILPLLRPGVVVHVHDVALPYEYPQSLTLGSGRLYNEQYLLSPLIAHGAYAPLFGSYRYLVKHGLWMSKERNPFITRGGSLWLQKA